MPIMRGPIHSASASAVIAARMPRSVRYWKTWKNDMRRARYSVRNSSIASVPSARERVDDSLEAVDAGTFDQYRGAGRQLGCQAGNQPVDVGKPLCIGAETRGGARRRPADTEHPGYARVARIGADIRMGGGGMLTELGHFTQHEPGRRGLRAQHIEPRPHRT